MDKPPYQYDYEITVGKESDEADTNYGFAKGLYGSVLKLHVTRDLLSLFITKSNNVMVRFDESTSGHSAFNRVEVDFKGFDNTRDNGSTVSYGLASQCEWYDNGSSKYYTTTHNTSGTLDGLYSFIKNNFDKKIKVSVKGYF